jgi:hypothetical protein
MEWVIRGFGLFYVVASAFLVRAMAVDATVSMLEQGLYGQKTKDRVRHYLLRIGAALTFASGLAMILIGKFTVPILIANCIAQGGWLLYARAHFPPEDEDEALGRRRTTNAFLVFCCVSAFTIWALTSGAVELHGGVVRAMWVPVATWLPLVGGVTIFIAMLVA